MVSSKKPIVVFVLGGPGAGKGTQCFLVEKEFNCKHLSAGDLLREERSDPTSVHKQLIEHYIKEGKIVPALITVSLLKKAIAKNKEAIAFLIDGFPRNMENLQGWNEVVGDFAEIRFVLHLECNFEAMEARVLARGLTSGRADDNMESIKKRYTVYETETKETLSHFRGRGMVADVDATGSIEKVSANVRAVFKQKLTPKQ